MCFGSLTTDDRLLHRATAENNAARLPIRDERDKSATTLNATILKSFDRRGRCHVTTR